MKAFLTFLLLLTILVPGDAPAQKKKGVPQSWLARYDLQAKHPRQFTLPGKIKEASGLAMSADGRLFSHDDERGVVYQLDYAQGKIVKQFSIGNFGVQEDFEGIAIKKDTIFLVTGGGQ